MTDRKYIPPKDGGEALDDLVTASRAMISHIAVAQGIDALDAIKAFLLENKGIVRIVVETPPLSVRVSLVITEKPDEEIVIFNGNEIDLQKAVH